MPAILASSAFVVGALATIRDVAADEIFEQAIGRWFAHGVTSRTHPVLRFVLRTFFAPLGIEADALEAEPFSSLESGVGDWWLHQPRWNAARVDRTHPAAADFGYLLEAPASFRVSVAPHGWLIFEPTPGAVRDLTVEAFMRSSEQGWLAARHSVQAAREAEAFLYAAVGALLADESLALLYASGDDEAFCIAVCETIREPNHRATNSALSSAAARATIVR